MNTLLVAGTDEGVGKTVLTLILALYWQTHRPDRPLGIFKPQCQGSDAALFTRSLSLSQSIEAITPFPLTTSPIAAERRGAGVALGQVWQQLEELRQRYELVLMEGFAGLGSPIAWEMTGADLARDWRLPTVLVVPVQPNTLSQAVAHVALAQHHQVHLKGIVLNCAQPRLVEEIHDWAPLDLLQSLTQTPVLGCIPHLNSLTDADKLVQIGSSLELEHLLPL